MQVIFFSLFVYYHFKLEFKLMEEETILCKIKFPIQNYTQILFKPNIDGTIAITEEFFSPDRTSLYQNNNH